MGVLRVFASAEVAPLTLRAMAAHVGPTDADHAGAVRCVLLSLGAGEDHHSITDRLGKLHIPNNTFPAKILLELAAEALRSPGRRRPNRSNT